MKYFAKKQATTWWKPPPSPFRPIWLLQPSSAPEILQTFANLSNLQNVAWQGWKWNFNNFASCHSSLLTLFCSHFEVGRYLTVRSSYPSKRRICLGQGIPVTRVSNRRAEYSDLILDSWLNLVITPRPHQNHAFALLGLSNQFSFTVPSPNLGLPIPIRIRVLGFRSGIGQTK